MSLQSTYQGFSGNATDGPLSLTLGDSTSVEAGVTKITSLVTTVTGGTAPVTITLTGLHNSYKDGTTAGQLSFTVPPGGVLSLTPTEPIVGDETIVITGTAGSGQTLAVTALTHFD